VEEFMDITHIIQKLEEFEKFKIVMFNSEQLALFNFISKELMSLDELKLNNHDMTIFKNFGKDKENLAQIIMNFREKIKFMNVDDIDRKLFSLLNEEMKLVNI
jgi:hypothetical protein